MEIGLDLKSCKVAQLYTATLQLCQEMPQACLKASSGFRHVNVSKFPCLGMETWKHFFTVMEDLIDLRGVDNPPSQRPSIDV